MRIKFITLLTLCVLISKNSNAATLLSPEDVMTDIARGKALQTVTGIPKASGNRAAVALGFFSKICPADVDALVAVFNRSHSSLEKWARNQTFEAHKKAASDFGGTIDSLTAEKDALQGTNADLTRQVVALKATVVEQERTIAAAATKQTELQGRIKTLTTDLQTEKTRLSKEVEKLTATLDQARLAADARIADLERQIQEERQKTRVEQDRVEEAVRDRATAGSAADEKKVALEKTIRELEQRMVQNSVVIAQLKAALDEAGLSVTREAGNRGKAATAAQKKPSSLAALGGASIRYGDDGQPLIESPHSRGQPTPSASPMSTPVGSLSGTPTQRPRSGSGLVEVSLDDSTFSSAAATPPSEGGVLGSLRRRFSGKFLLTSPISGPRTLPHAPSQASPLGTVPVFTSPVVRTRPLVDPDSRRSSDETGTASDLSSTDLEGDTLTSPPGGPQGGSVEKDRRPALTVQTGDLPLEAVNGENSET